MLHGVKAHPLRGSLQAWTRVQLHAPKVSGTVHARNLPVSLLLRLLATDGREAALSAAIIEHALTCWQ